VFSSLRFSALQMASAVIAFTLVNIPLVGLADDQSQQRAEFDSRKTQPDLSAAIDAARKRVAAARPEANAKPLMLSDALVVLGDAARAGDINTEAEAAYREALSIVEKETGPTNPRRLAPLRGLGLTLAEEGKHEEAVGYLSRAFELSRRTDGLFNTGQLEILDQLALSEQRLKDMENAKVHMSYYESIGEQAFGKRDPRMVAVHCAVGDWWTAGRAYLSARASYERAFSIGKKALGPDDLSLVRPLRSIAYTYVYELTDLSDHNNEGMRVRRDSMHLARTSIQEVGPDPRNLNSEGQDALERAVKILESHPEAREILVGTLLQLGDWHMIKGEREEAMQVYGRVSGLAKEEPLAAAALSLPARLYYPLPPTLISSKRLAQVETSDRYVLLEYNVTEFGTVDEARIVETNATSRHANQILDAIRNARFRPRFVNGTPVNATGMQYREVYKVRKDDEDDEEAS
jgi:tetratricopeptide (TPR) repeat protein